MTVIRPVGRKLRIGWGSTQQSCPGLGPHKNLKTHVVANFTHAANPAASVTRVHIAETGGHGGHLQENKAVQLIPVFLDTAVWSLGGGVWGLCGRGRGIETKEMLFVLLMFVTV